MATLDALFADLLAGGDSLPRPTPGDNGDIGDKRASARLAARIDGGDTLATSGDIQAAGGAVSPNVATVSPLPNRPQSEQRRGLSPMSPMSPASRVHALSPVEAIGFHWPPWSEPEIQTFVARVALFMRRGVSATDADDLAERLTLRDRDGDGDDRRMCIECRHLERGGRCAMARAGRLHGVDRRFEPVRTMLQRCDVFERHETHASGHEATR